MMIEPRMINIVVTKIYFSFDLDKSRRLLLLELHDDTESVRLT